MLDARPSDAIALAPLTDRITYLDEPNTKKDFDADGVVDALDACPKVPEDMDGFEDSDGCPEVDNDKDGVVDSEDGCPIEPEAFDGRGLSRYVRDVYTWAHAPIVAGIIFAAAALEEITLHPSDPLDVDFRVMLAGGLALTIVGVAAAIWRAFRAIAKERIVAGVVLAAIAGLAGDLDGVWLLVLVDLVILVTLLVEHRRIER